MATWGRRPRWRPTRDMLEVGERWQHSPIFPEIEFTTAEKYLQQIPVENLPIWEDELYLEFHRGCYTSHADQKRWNRFSEGLLYEAELFATFAHLTCGLTYPQLEIETAWKQVLFQQFHDILPGSSITQVYEDALSEWQQVQAVGTRILETSLLAIASQTSLPTPPHPQAKAIFVFNSLNWGRSQVVTINLTKSKNGESGNWRICDLAGEELESQQSHTQTSILFLANNIPACGYRVFWLCPGQPRLKSDQTPAENLILENEYLQVTVNPQTGELSSIFDKIQQREILDSPGNQLQAYQDSGQYWDAWNIDPNYSQHPLPAAELLAISNLEQGSLYNCVRVVRKIGKSEFNQDYILETKSRILKIKTTVNWQESQVLVKAAFGFNISADFATYEIPCGAIRRPTQPQTPAEQAKWEVPALRWGDLTGESWGVSLLNDCKYGYSSKPNQLNLTLLRSPHWPDPQADQGHHEFTYAVYPHPGSWESAHTVRKGYELNIPLQIMVDPLYNQEQKIRDDGQGISFLDLSAENLILMALKLSEDHPEKLILRAYECHGATAELCLHSDLDLTLGKAVDLLENSPTEILPLMIEPGKIVTFEVIQKKSPEMM